jgi:NitT/TauT family transport system substrate-binding protein
MVRRKRSVFAAFLGGLALLAAGCGGGASPSQSAGKPAAPAPATAKAPAAQGGGSTAAKPLTPVKVLLDWQVEGYQAPFFLAVKDGYYRDAGLDVTLVPGKGSGATAQQVGHGNYPIGFADAGTTATAITKGVPDTVVACYFQKSPVAVIFKPTANITKPSDLIGKTVGTSAGSASDNLFNALAAANHFKRSQVKMENMEANAKIAALQSGKVDAILNYDIDTVPVLAAKGIQTKYLLFSDWGVPALSTAVIVNDGYLKAHPDVVRAFIAATSKAWEAARKDPQAAIDAESAIAGQMHQKMPANAIGELKLAFDLLHTKNSQGHPLGWMAPADWKATLNVLQKYLGVKNVKSPDAYYTNRYIG